MSPKSPPDSTTPCSLPTTSRSGRDEPLLDFPTTLSALTCIQRGLCPRGTHSIYYEVHGSSAATGDDDDDDEHLVSPKRLKNKMVFIMGLNSTCTCWGLQVRWFGGGVPRLVGDEEEEYTVLVFDHRGVGNSGYPRGLYS